MMGGSYDDQKIQRIEELERLLEEHKSEINNLSTQLKQRDIEMETAASPRKRLRDDNMDHADNYAENSPLSKRMKNMQDGE